MNDCPTCGEPWSECCEHVERWCIVHEHDPVEVVR